MKNKINLTLWSLITIVLLSGCGSSIEEKIHTNLEEAVNIEESKEVTNKIHKLETKNNELFNNIASLNDEKLDDINKLSKEAIEINKKLKESLDDEQVIFNDAKKEFEKSESLIKKVEDTEKKLGLKMYGLMSDRYDKYDEFVEEYNKLADERINFFEIIKEKEVEEEKVLNQVKKINKHNEQVINLNNDVNEKTQKYNELKKDFYNVLDIKVEYEE